MLVQKREDGAGPAGPMIKIKVCHGTVHHELSVPAQSTFGNFLNFCLFGSSNFCFFFLFGYQQFGCVVFISRFLYKFGGWLILISAIDACTSFLVA